MAKDAKTKDSAATEAAIQKQIDRGNSFTTPIMGDRARDEFNRLVDEGSSYSEATAKIAADNVAAPFKAATMREKARQSTSDILRRPSGMKKGGKVKKMASGGKVSSASKRADGCAQRGKTRGKMV